MSGIAVTLVLQLHRPRSYGESGGYTVCGECRQVWPCETVNVIEGAARLVAQQSVEPDPAPVPEAPTGPTPRIRVTDSKRRRK